MLTYKNLPQIKPLVTYYQYKPYYYYNINNQKLVEYFLSLIKKENIIFIIKDRDYILGAAVAVDLPWDSSIFRIKMAKISFLLAKEECFYSYDITNKLLLNILSFCREKNIRHISCQVNINETFLIHTLEKNRFKLVDTIIIYSIFLKNYGVEKINWNYVIREATNKDLLAMQELAGTAFFTPNIFLSRFYVDPLLRKKANNLYEEWLRNSFKGEQADIVFIVENNNKPFGFITCQLPKKKSKEILNKKIATVPLNAISSEFRGQGIYHQLVKHSLDWFKKQDVDWVEIKTQIVTLPVQQTWQKLGGKLVSSYHTFHKEL